MELRTSRTVIRTVEEADAASLLPIWSDPEVVRFTYVRGIHTVDDCVARIRRQRQWTDENGGVGPFVVTLADETVGFCGLTKKQDQPRVYDLFYHFKKCHWGRGLGTEVANALVGAAFGPLGAGRVTASAVASNLPSNRILLKLGMSSDGVAPGGFENEQGTFDLNLYQIDAAGYSGSSEYQ